MIYTLAYDKALIFSETVKVGVSYTKAWWGSSTSSSLGYHALVSGIMMIAKSRCIRLHSRGPSQVVDSMRAIKWIIK